MRSLILGKTFSAGKTRTEDVMEARLPTRIEFGREICGHLQQAEAREWWLANGIGGYAAGTVAGSLTRRYHGLLIVPVRPPLGRVLVVAKADATLIDGAEKWPLFTNHWGGGTVDPGGHVHIESFHLDGRMPVWRYAMGDIRLEVRIWMESGGNTTYVAYRLESTPFDRQREVKLQVELLINARDHHGQAQPGDFSPITTIEHGQLRISHPNWFTLYAKSHGGVFTDARYWVENLDLSVERERGLPDRDNHLCVGEPPQIEGPVKGITVDHKKLGRHFSESMGWNEETMISTRESLENLGGMKHVIQDLYG